MRARWRRARAGRPCALGARPRRGAPGRRAVYRVAHDGRERRKPHAEHVGLHREGVGNLVGPRGGPRWRAACRLPVLACRHARLCARRAAGGTNARCRHARGAARRHLRHADARHVLGRLLDDRRLRLEGGARGRRLALPWPLQDAFLRRATLLCVLSLPGDVLLAALWAASCFRERLLHGLAGAFGRGDEPGRVGPARPGRLADGLTARTARALGACRALPADVLALDVPLRQRHGLRVCPRVPRDAGAGNACGLFRRARGRRRRARGRLREVRVHAGGHSARHSGAFVCLGAGVGDSPYDRPLHQGDVRALCHRGADCVVCGGPCAEERLGPRGLRMRGARGACRFGPAVRGAARDVRWVRVWRPSDDAQPS